MATFARGGGMHRFHTVLCVAVGISWTLALPDIVSAVSPGAKTFVVGGAPPMEAIWVGDLAPIGRKGTRFRGTAQLELADAGPLALAAELMLKGGRGTYKFRSPGVAFPRFKGTVRTSGEPESVLAVALTLRRGKRDKVKLKDAGRVSIRPPETTTTVPASSTTTLVNGCNCGAPNPTTLVFTSVVGTGICGRVEPPGCVQGNAVGTPCTSDADCAAAGGGLCVGDLKCGVLYLGAASVTMPLPVTVPDGGVSVMKVGPCVGDGTELELAPTVPGDPGASIRTCTSATVPNTDYPACVGGPTPGRPCNADADCGSAGTCTGNQLGCLFGPPLPILNPPAPATSVCMINRVAANASGLADCDAGTSSIDVSLTADIYLTGDLVDAETGIQSCPLCTTGTCKGGPNDGQACTPGSGDREAYPTSHDCPPPATAYIAGLPMPFALTTGTSQKVAVDIGPDVQANTFCGFCGQPPPGVTFYHPPTRCTADADCASFATFMKCRQRTPGAFGNGLARTITMTGSPAGDVRDRLPHAAILASVFCIPSSYSLIVDTAGDLPGPGAVSIAGRMRLLP